MSSISQPPPKEAIKSPYLSIEEWVSKTPAVYKGKRTLKSYTSPSISEFSKAATGAGATWSSSPNLLTFNEETGKLEKVELEKELTEKQLFSKLKKELKQVKNLIN